MQLSMEMCNKGISVFKMFVCGDISFDMGSEILFMVTHERGHKPEFPLYILQYTSLNELFEYEYPHFNALGCLFTVYTFVLYHIGELQLA